ncbi:MAG: FprA family A-type flavoprotein [Clostridia bacterium]|nr:FprA family A-type flavoprotein [Clostridia bacterium]
MKITDKIFQIGVNDYNIDLFEGQYHVENGMAYNSYIIHDEKIAVLDTVDKNFGDEWLGNIKSVLGEKQPDYLIVHHMEPDHASNIDRFTKEYPSAKIVSNSKSFLMMKQFFGSDYINNQIVVGEGDALSLGEHELTFITAPMVHWPEVILSYEKTTKTLFSADAFGKFGTRDTDEEWDCEARRYYFGIVGKYGAQVQTLLKKAANLEIERICPLHGPVLTENLSHYINLYNTWSSYEPETKGVAICYTSVYGNTEKAVRLLEKELLNNGCEKVSVSNLARCDMAEAVEDAFRYDRLVLATTTYNGGIFPFMNEFIHHLTERNFQNRTVAIIENGSWALMAEKTVKSMLEKSKNINYTECGVHIKSAVSDENSAEIAELAKELCK